MCLREEGEIKIKFIQIYFRARPFDVSARVSASIGLPLGYVDQMLTYCITYYCEETTVCCLLPWQHKKKDYLPEIPFSATILPWKQPNFDFFYRIFYVFARGVYYSKYGDIHHDIDFSNCYKLHLWLTVVIENMSRLGEVIVHINSESREFFL